MSSDTAKPAYYPLSHDDHAALVVVAAIIFLIYAIVGLITKLLIRLNIASMKDHDIILLVGTVFLFVQTACVVAACNHGLGQHIDAVSSSDFQQFSKLMYASRIIALGVDGCTKLSLCLLIRQIDNSGRLNKANLVLGGVILVWLASGFFATVFQCPLPSPWLADDTHKCPNRGPIFVYNGVMNILTDLAICILPVAMMWSVQTTTKRKLVVMALFLTRIIVPITMIPSLATATYLFHEDSDSTWLAVSSTIWFQVSLGLSVLTACIPSLKGIIDSLLGSTSVAAIQAPYDLRDSGKKSGLEATSKLGSNKANTEGSGLGADLRLTSRGKSPNYTSWSADREMRAKYGGNNSPEGSDGGSESVRKLTEGVIVVRDEFEVHYTDGRRSQSHGSRESIDAGYRVYAS